MKTLKSALVLTAAVAALAFAAAPTAFAGPGQKKTASPAQPIPYSQLEAYRTATPRQRASRDWSAGVGAETGGRADTSGNVPMATQPAEPSASPAPSDPAPGAITPPIGAAGGDTAATGGPPK